MFNLNVVVEKTAATVEPPVQMTGKNNSHDLKDLHDVSYPNIYKRA